MGKAEAQQRLSRECAQLSPDPVSQLVSVRAADPRKVREQSIRLEC